MRWPEPQPQRSELLAPYMPIVVLRELCGVARRARALYVSDDWQFVLRTLSHESRAETAQALRSVAFVAQAMAESLEKEPVIKLDEVTNPDERHGKGNYGLQH
jgi:hypothetical protein